MLRHSVRTNMRIPCYGGKPAGPTGTERRIESASTPVFSLLLRDDIREFLPCPFSALRVLCTFRKYGLAPINEFIKLLFIYPRVNLANEHIMISSC